MAAGRLIQTTLVSDPYSASFLFIGREHLQQKNIFRISEALGLMPLHGHDGGGDSYDSRTFEMAVLVISSPYRLGTLANGVGLDANIEDLKSTWAKDLLRTESIVVANSPPVQTDFVSLVRGGSGAAIGAYVGWNVGQATPPLLLVTVPAGMIICAAAMALSQAIEQGLGPRLIKLLGGAEHRSLHDQ